MAEEFPSQYDPKSVEKSRYDFWLKLGIFTADPVSKKQKFSIVMPPPNVTGVLHMGHALTCTLEDILARRKRMLGFNTLWLPGTDHAGIATQMVVERNLLREEKISRHDLGRERFLQKVWEWKEKSQDTILGQLREIGCSVDWSRLRFTLDEELSVAVRECFVRLFREDLIYRSTAIIQWCPSCRTALSDLEVKAKETHGKLWHIRYLLKDSAKQWITVATTRPETLLGDVAVAVHPQDKRYKKFHGKSVLVPLARREIPVIADSYVEKEFGTGALKITPGHDPNDYEVGKRHALPVLSVMDEKAHMTDEAGAYKGLSREEARARVLEDLKAQSLLEREEPHTHHVGHCDRCGTVVEPRVSQQWFVKAAELAREAIRVVESGEIKIIPEEWTKTYFEWMTNIRPWCISRQLWWGHRIPVWYCGKCEAMMVEVDAPSRCSRCESTDLRQDEDVLDTWFSSGLWPFSTMGWPKETADLRAFYPTDVLETGFDILFFWVARMIMLGLKMTGRVPFHTIYLHPMVRDEYGQKMSKTKGNVKDPLEIIETIGADSLRFFFASNAYHGRDVRVTETQLESARNYVNKIWNAARFVAMNFGEIKKENIDWENEINQWIWTSLNETKREVNQALDQYRFFDAAFRLYHFLWDEYCYWFIEFIKSPEELMARKQKQESTAIQVLEEVLRLLHPIMPFVTEELWQRLPLRGEFASIAVAPYPTEKDDHVFPETRRRVDRVCRTVAEIRRVRGVHHVSPAKEISAQILASDPTVERELRCSEDLIRKLSKVRVLVFCEAELPAKTHLGIVLSDLRIFVSRDDLGDTAGELARMQKEFDEKQNALKRAEDKLRNERFMENAPEEIREGVRKQRDSLKKELDALEKYLEDLKR